MKPKRPRNATELLERILTVAQFAKDSGLWDLLAEWDKRYRQGEELSPEELCKHHPELLEDVRMSITSWKSVNCAVESKPPNQE